MRTLDDTLTAASADMALGGCGIPNPAWPFTYGNYCCASVTRWLDCRHGAGMAMENISIAALRAWWKWPEGKKPKPGALVLMNFSGTQDAEHIGLCESVQSDGVHTMEGNTGPLPGVPNPNGFYRRVRPSAYIVGYVYPPYPSKPAPIQETGVNEIQTRRFHADQALTGGTWKTLQLETPGAYSFTGDDGPISAVASFAFQKLAEGQVVQARFVKVAVSALGKEGAVTAGSLMEIHGSAGQSFGQVHDLLTLAKGERARVQVLGPDGTSLVSGSVKWHS